MATVTERRDSIPFPAASTATPVAERWYSEKRLGGLSRFALAITVLNLLGHAFLGFEQSWITPFVALATGYGTDLLAETMEAHSMRRTPRYASGVVNLVRFLLPAHISALAVGMLLYPGANLAAVAFATSVAIASKYVIRQRVGTSKTGHPILRHVFNPSNFGITVTLLLFPTVGIAPPYQFAENTSGAIDWILPVVVVTTGTFLNYKMTGRIALIIAWTVGFAMQAIVRSWIHGTPVAAALVPMSGFAFVLFTFYMITDPATSPATRRGQVNFGLATALLYAALMESHIVFGLFFALTVTTAIRALWLWNTQRTAGARPLAGGEARQSRNSNMGHVVHECNPVVSRDGA